MSSASRLQTEFPVALNIVHTGANTFDELLAFRERGKAYLDAVDNFSFELFARFLNTDIVHAAFDNGKDYIVKQAYRTREWCNKEKHTAAIQSFPFSDYFVKNRFQAIDEFFIGAGLINELDVFRRPALWYAVRMGDLKRVKLLLANGAKLNVGSDNSYAYAAANMGSLDIVAFLMTNGHDSGINPIRIPRLDIVEYMMSIPNTNFVLSRDADGRRSQTLVYYLGMDPKTSGDVRKIIDRLAKDKRYLEATDSHGTTPIFYTLGEIKRRGIDDLRILLENGADVNHVEKNGTTPLLDVIMHSIPMQVDKIDVHAVMRLLFLYGANPRRGGYIILRSITDMTTMIAYIRCIREFFPDDLDSIVNERDADGNTAVAVLARDGHKYIGLMTYLVENGANATDADIGTRVVPPNLRLSADIMKRVEARRGRQGTEDEHAPW